VICAFVLPTTPILAASAQDERHDLLILVYAPDVGAAQVALSYSGVVDHGALAAGIEDLGGRTGATITDVAIQDEQQAQGMPGEGTAAGFVASGLIRADTGVLPVGPLIRSLPKWEHARLVFIVGEQFSLVGPTSVVADGYAVQLVDSMKPYEYDVERKSGSIIASSVLARQGNWRGLIPAMLLGLPAGAVVGWLLGSWGVGQGTKAGR